MLNVGIYLYIQCDRVPFPMGAQCAVTAKGSLLGSVRSLLPVQCALTDLGDNSFPGVNHDWHAVPSLGPIVYVWYLWKPQGIVARVLIGKVIMSIFTKLQNKEPGDWGQTFHRVKPCPGCQVHISKNWIY